MEFREYLISKGVTEEQATEIVGGMPEKEFHLTKEEKLDERYAKLKQQKEDVDTQLETANTTITDLKKSNQTNEELQTKISEYEGKIETLEQESADIQKQSAIELALVKNGARNPKAVKGLLDVEKVELTDEGVKGLEEQLEALKESDAYLFQTKDDNGSPHIQSGEDPNGQGQDEIDAFEEAANKFI